MSLELKSANGSILLSSEDGTGQANVTLPRGGFLGDSGYQWIDEKANRVAGTTYTNTTGKPMYLSIYSNGTGNSGIVVDGVRVAQTYIDQTANVECIIPSGSTYSLDAANNLYYWFELK